MNPRSLCLIVISVGIAGFVNFVLTNPIADSSESTSELSKVFLDCKHSDYRTYIQCLKREKRHQHELLNMEPACFEKCMSDCVTMNHACEDTCRHCIQARKIRHRIINITETETACISGNCSKVDEHKPVIVNVTNHIHIHNYYNKSTTGEPNHPTPTHCPCIHIVWLPCYCRPQYQICQYQQQWPCVPYGGYGGGYGGGFISGGYAGSIDVPPVISSIGGVGATSINCVCPNAATKCDECNPPA